MSKIVDAGISLMVGVIVLVAIVNFIDANIASFTGTTLLVVGFLGTFFALQLLRQSARGVTGDKRRGP